MSLVSIYVGGFLTLVIAFYHTRLYKKLNWFEAFEKIENNTADVFYTINLALTILFFMIGVLSILYAKELSLSSGLAFGFCLSYSIFWVWRLIWQITWQNKRRDQPSDRPEIGKLLIPLLIIVCYISPVVLNTFS